MNTLEREELDQLKTRQAELRVEVLKFGHRLDAFELRLIKPAETPEPLVLVTPVATDEPRAKPFSPPPIPPIILPAVSAPSPVPKPSPAKSPDSVFTANPVPKPISVNPPQPTETAPPVCPTKRPSFEMRLGTYWLVRIGIVMLLTSLVFFGNYAYQNFIPRLGALGKVTLLYLASGVLLGIGGWLQRKQESLKNYAQVLQAGGLAAVYFTTYAAHHFLNLQIIKSPLTDGLLLFVWTGFITWLADRKKSEVLAIFAVLLGYYTSIITHAGLFTLFSNLVLTLAAVFFLVRHRWATVSFASLAATYVSYAFWRFFHAGQWQWADPSEGLWIGNYFLIGYWLLFTAAVFLSRHEQFNGQRRAAFLSLNNGAFFSAFLLTMLQVHQGGFWKFALSYGTVLIVLAALAQKLLARDKLCRNTYLTQGLLLVTLGFLTHLTGLKLTLVLAVESTMLLVLGRQFSSRVMQVGSFITSALATGWAAVTIAPFDHNGLIIGVSVGALMLWNAFWLRRDTTYKQSTSHAPTLFYTTLSLVIWLVTTWQNSTPAWRALAFAIESVAFLLAARPLGNQFLKFGSCAFAALSLGWEANTLADQFNTVEFSHRVGLAPAIILGGVLLFNALWEQYQSPSKDSQRFDASVSFFSALGLLTWLVTTVVFTRQEYLAPTLAVEALILTAACYPLRLKELVVFGQLYLLLGQTVWLYDAVVAHATHPWWNPALIIGATLLLAAWWPRQKFLSLNEPSGLVLQGLHALAIVAVLQFWLAPQFSPPTWLAFTSALAIILTAYATLNRFWLLAATGQIFVLLSGWQFFAQLWQGKPVWYLPLVPVATLCLLSFCAVKWFERRPGTRTQLRQPILNLARIYRILALGMSLCWIHQYIPTQDQIWFLSAIGVVLFLFSGWQKDQELLVFGTVFTVAALAEFWLPQNGTGVYWPDLLAILAPLAQQHLAQRRREYYPLPRQIHAGTIVVGSLSLWLFVSRCILQQASGFYLTAGWSVLALVLFIVGMILSERVYRWLGLAVLACALGRVVIFDVWKLETLYRIFSFMALGIVLLVLGFIYNKYQDKINQWL